MGNDAEVKLQVKLDDSTASKSLDSMKDKASKLENAFESAGKKLTVGLTVPITGLIASGIKYNSQMEQFQASLTTLLGSADKATDMLGTLKNMANTTPFETTDLISATQTMLGFGMSAGDSMNALQMLGDVSMGNKDKLSGLSLVFAQVQSQGKLMGQDLLQMINNGFNPLTEISKMTGKSMSELKDDMANGAISADMVTQAFKHATSEGGLFYGAMDKQSQTVEGRMSTLKDAFDTATGSLTESLLPAMSETVDKFTAFANWVASLDDGQKKMILTILQVAAVVGPILIIASKLIGFINLLASATWLWNGALLANPITWIVVGIVSLIVAIIALILNFNKVKAVFVSMWNGIQSGIQSMQQGFEDLKNKVGEKADEIKQFFISLGTSISTIFSNIINTIINYFNSAKTFIGNIFQSIGSVIVAIAMSIGNAFVSAFNAVVAFLTPIVSTIVNIISIPFNFLKNLFILIVALIAMGLEAIFNIVYPIILNIVSAMQVAWSVISSLIGIAINYIVSGFTALYNTIINVCNTIFNFITGIITTLHNFIFSVLTAVGQIFLTIFNWIYTNVIQPVVGFIEERINTMWTTLINGINNVKNIFMTIFNWIASNVFIPLFNTISNIFNNIWNTISNIINRIRDAFSIAGDSIKTTFSNLRDAIGNMFNALGGIIKTPINGIIGAINKVIGGLNKIKVPDWVPGMGGATVNFSTLPYLSVGTNNVKREGLAYLHQGEAVVPKKYNPALGGNVVSGNSSKVLVDVSVVQDSLGQWVNTVKTYSNGSKYGYNN